MVGFVSPALSRTVVPQHQVVGDVNDRRYASPGMVADGGQNW